MNVKDIKELLELMNEHDLAEMEIEREGMTIKLKKTPSGSLSIVPASAPATVQSIPAPAAAPAAPASEAQAASAPSAKGKEIASPMVGTFYRSPSPDADPFVEIGQVVEVGQVVCIVEAMKLMNEIKSEVRGKIVEAAVDNAEPVEFGQTLFIVEPV